MQKLLEFYLNINQARTHFAFWLCFVLFFFTCSCIHLWCFTLPSCASFSIYTTYGDTCENLAMKLNAFFGILFGSLAFVVLVIAIIILIVYCYRKKKHFKERYGCCDMEFNNNPTEMVIPCDRIRSVYILLSYMFFML